MDVADKGNEYAERMLEASVAAVRRRAETPLTPTGACLNCDEPVEAPLTFCDADCRADYDWRLAVRQRSGS